MRRLLAVPGWSCLLAVASCATTEPVETAPHLNVSPEALDPGGAPGAGEISIGLEADANESDSLDRLEVLPGVRVRSVEPSGPAAAAGVRAGDVILSLGGIETNHPDALAAILAGASDGDRLVAAVRRDTAGIEATIVARATAAADPPREVCRVDPIRTRAEYATEAEPGRVTVRILRILPKSPLPGAGLGPGDRIVALDGEPLASAQDLVTRLVEEREPGDPVRLGVVRDGGVVETRVRLWAPARRLSALAALPLFQYRSRLRPRTTELSLIDLWIVSLFSYRREEGEREYRILTLLRFGTGRGELIDETPAEAVSR